MYMDNNIEVFLLWNTGSINRTKWVSEVRQFLFPLTFFSRSLSTISTVFRTWTGCRVLYLVFLGVKKSRYSDPSVRPTLYQPSSLQPVLVTHQEPLPIRSQETLKKLKKCPNFQKIYCLINFFPWSVILN